MDKPEPINPVNLATLPSMMAVITDLVAVLIARKVIQADDLNERFEASKQELIDLYKNPEAAAVVQSIQKSTSTRRG